MATAIFFNGRRINVPQAVSEIDASALAAVSPSAVGIVALLGTAEGGKPLDACEEFADSTRSDSLRNKYRSGDLLTAGLFAFEPSADDAVPGGAQRLVTVKVNDSTQSIATLVDAAVADAVDLTSSDWGQFTEQINIDVAAGTVQGKLITIIFEDVTETFDDVGGDAIMDVLYTPGTDGWDVPMPAAIAALGFTATGSKAETGLGAEMTAVIPAGLPAGLEILSAGAEPTQPTVTIYGLVGVVATRETLTLTAAGVTAVPTASLLWDKVLGASISGTTANTVTVRVAGGGATALTIGAGADGTAGVVLVSNGIAAGVLTVSIDVNAAFDAAYFGINSAGAEVQERFDMTLGTTPVVGVVPFADVDVIALGDFIVGRTVTATLTTISVLVATFPTVQRVVDRLNALDGITANATVSNPTTFNLVDADYAAAADITTPAQEYYADLYEFITAINEGSQYIDAARATAASAVPANLAAPVFLAGGTEGPSTITEWQTAFTALQKRRVNIIVPLSRDPAVHSLCLTHLVARAGRLRSEANGYIGHADTDLAGTSLTVTKSEIVALQSRHLSHLAQEIQRFDAVTGEATFYSPYHLAAICAGMQAGSAIGEPLTRKRPIATDIRQDSSWTVEDNVESLIDAGLMMFEKIDGIGIRCVRSITGHLADDNLVFTEMSANESANTAVFEFRTALERKIGQRALAGTAAAIKGLANDVLGRLIDDEIIVAYRALQVEQIGDVFPVSVEIAPVVPVNFIPITVHLVALRTAA